MKLTLKNLKNCSFSVEIDDTKTVWNLKEEISEHPLVNSPPEKQRIIYAGKILENKNQLKSYGIEENKFVVVMATKYSTIASVPPYTTGQNVSPTFAPAAAAAESPEPNQPQTPVTTAVNLAESLANLAHVPSLETNENMVRSIVDMGYPEADVRHALRASFNNPDRAIEFLIEGIPMLNDLCTAPAAAPTSTLTNTTPTVTNTTPASSSDSALDFLRNDPRFNQIRRVLQQRPELLTTVLVRIAESNPALLSVIREHQADFVRMLNEAQDEDPEMIPIGIVLTEQERETVERFVAMGFEREMVVQAYMACEKDEQATADLLCSQLEEDEPPQHQ